MKSLLEYTVEELLEFHSRDKAIPGAGSMAALTSLNAASSILRVIKVTRRDSRYNHLNEYLDDSIKIILEDIMPKLRELHQEDAIQFKKHIDLRIEKRDTVDLDEKAAIQDKIINSMMPCIEIPLEIANYTLKLIDICDKLTKDGAFFVNAEASSSINNCISTIGTCISTVDLNLCYMPKDKWSLQKAKESDNLTEIFKDNFSRVVEYQLIAKKRRNWNLKGKTEFKNKFLYGYKDSNLKVLDIESLVKDLINTLFVNKSSAWRVNIPEKYKDVIQPKKILKLLGYEYFEATSLGQYFLNGKKVEVAGFTDHNKKIVGISTQYSLQSRYFTLCHELGHVIMHKGDRLYRDGSHEVNYNKYGQDWKEYQANVFAKNLSMPDIIVKEVFKSIFSMDKFRLNSETIFRLNKGNINEIKRKYPIKRSLSVFLAGLEFYNHQRFESMADVFRVSKTAMAIRLEELDLLEY